MSLTVWFNDDINVWWADPKLGKFWDFNENSIEDMGVNWSLWRDDMPVINWTFPFESFILSGKVEDLPSSIKIKVDNNINNIVYFVKQECLTDLSSQDNMGNSILSYRYKMDDWQSFVLKMHQIWKQNNNIRTTYLAGLRARYLFWYDTGHEDEVDHLHIDFNYWYMPYHHCWAENGQVMKDLVWSTNRIQLNELNAFDDSEFVKYDELDSTNKYHRIICKSSALKKWIGAGPDDGKAVNMGDNTILIIPIVGGDSYTANELIKAMQRVDITSTDTTIDPLASGELIKDYNSEIPSSTLIKAFNLTPQIGTIKYTEDDGSTSNVKFDYFAIDCTASATFKLRDFSVGGNVGLSQQISNVIHNSSQIRDITTEPALLHPLINYEQIDFDDSYKIRYDMSHLQYSYNPGDAAIADITLWLTVSFPGTEMISYSFGNETDPYAYMSQYNPFFNNYSSNLRVANPNDKQLLGSAAADFYDRNFTAGWTQVANINATNNNLRNNLAFTYEKGIVSMGVSGAQAINSFISDAIDPEDIMSNNRNVIGAVGSILNTSLNMAQSTMNNKYQIDMNNRNLRSSLASNVSSASPTVSQPFISSYNKAELGTDGQPIIFKTFLYSLPNWQQQSILNNIVNDGYNFYLGSKYVRNADNTEWEAVPTHYADYDICQFSNIIKMDTSVNVRSYMKEIFDSDIYNWIFSSKYYILKALNYLGDGVKLWKIDTIVDDNENYFNIESNLPDIPGEKINIINVIDVYNIGVIDNNYTLQTLYNAIIAVNPRIDITHFTVDDIVIISQTNTQCTWRVAKTNTYYFGNVFNTYEIKIIYFYDFNIETGVSYNFNGVTLITNRDDNIYTVSVTKDNIYQYIYTNAPLDLDNQDYTIDFIWNDANTQYQVEMKMVWDHTQVINTLTINTTAPPIYIDNTPNHTYYLLSNTPINLDNYIVLPKSKTFIWNYIDVSWNQLVMRDTYTIKFDDNHSANYELEDGSTILQLTTDKSWNVPLLEVEMNLADVFSNYTEHVADYLQFDCIGNIGWYHKQTTLYAHYYVYWTNEQWKRGVCSIGCTNYIEGWMLTNQESNIVTVSRFSEKYPDSKIVAPNNILFRV